jgi:hypothetical protein
MYGFSKILLDFTVGHATTIKRAVRSLRPATTGKGARLKFGDTVREKLALFHPGNETGVVVQTYPFDGEYRCVVKFDSGRESVYFERELIVTNRS